MRRPEPTHKAALPVNWPQLGFFLPARTGIGDSLWHRPKCLQFRFGVEFGDHPVLFTLTSRRPSNQRGNCRQRVSHCDFNSHGCSVGHYPTINYRAPCRRFAQIAQQFVKDSPSVAQPGIDGTYTQHPPLHLRGRWLCTPTASPQNGQESALRIVTQFRGESVAGPNPDCSDRWPSEWGSGHPNASPADTQRWECCAAWPRRG